jgi:hypothetical protein
MPKLNELMGRNERASGYVNFSFDIYIDEVPVEDEQRLYEELMETFGRWLSAMTHLLPEHTLMDGQCELRMEDVDVTYEDDYDRLGSIDCDL